MNEELIKDIFITIAFKAMDSGKEIRLEKGKNTSKSKVLGGGNEDLTEEDEEYEKETEEAE